MVTKETPIPRLWLDKVDRRLARQIQTMKPEYAEFDLYLVAKVELRNRLLSEVAKLKNSTTVHSTVRQYSSGREGVVV